MAAQITYRKRLARLIYFFPFQLVWLQLKKNHLLLIFWVILFGFAAKAFAVKFGVPNLLLFPEYLGHSGVWAFMILGFSLGGFIMAFNIYTYILHAFRFPFLATISRPFAKFCINNFILPVAFNVVYCLNSADFQKTSEFLTGWEITLNLLSFVFGQALFILFSLAYFFGTNKDIFKLTGKTEEELFFRSSQPPKTPPPSVRSKKRWYFTRSYRREWRVETYLRTPVSIALARKSSHYHKETIRSVFAQNHVNATFFEVAVIASFLLIGSFRENQVFVIPAMATVFLMFTMFLMLLSIFISWLRSWTFTILIVIFLLFNFASSHFDWARIDNHAYGLDYTVPPADYSTAAIDALRNDSVQLEADVNYTIEILNNWRRKNSTSAITKGKKPKLVIINTSGGGSRSALWTFRAIQYNDSLLAGALMRHAAVITGSSGGMVGAAFLRQLHLDYAAQNKFYFHHPEHLSDISRDILNPILFSLATNDLFIRYQKFEVDSLIYTKDRATSFERQLNQITGGRLNKKLMDYREPEFNAEVPMMIFAPTITDDNRRLIVAAQPMSYLSNNLPHESMRNTPLTENIEFMRLFEKQRADNIEFLSVLRMNATFPYVMPSVSMPSRPKIQVMDAGLRDNFGFRNTLQFIAAFRNWISTNTSGIVIIQVRDKEKDFEPEESGEISIIESLTNPLGSVYGNFTKVQDYTHDQLLQYTSFYFDQPIDVVNFELHYPQEEPISLSWHLTSREKALIIQSVNHPTNRAASLRLRELLTQ